MSRHLTVVAAAVTATCLFIAPSWADSDLKVDLSPPAGRDDMGKINLSGLPSSQGTPSPNAVRDNPSAIDSRIEWGPSRIALRDQATLTLPPGYGFLPQAPAQELWKQWGHITSDDIVGLIVPSGGERWLIAVAYVPAGYVRDDDASTWNADELLNTIREATNRDNERRKQLGRPELEVEGWVEKPHYDPTARRLIWSISVRNKGASPNSAVNYQMAALGRQGYLSMTMVTQLNDIAAQKGIAATLLSDVQFNSGKRYSDFNPSTDRVAEYGLAALVAGIAVKKLGLFALAAAFFAKAAKLIAVAAVGTFAWFRRLYRRKKNGSEAAPDLRATAATDAPTPSQAIEAK
jgi:uncharacterized membrane-anchored protein